MRGKGTGAVIIRSIIHNQSINERLYNGFQTEMITDTLEKRYTGEREAEKS